MQDKEKVIVNGQIYEYSEYYERLCIDDTSVLSDNGQVIPHVLCPKCKADIFKLQYGNYQINAICKCGHFMTVYDG